MFKRIASIVVALSGGRILTLLRNVFVIPILVSTWGLPYYGEWVLISSLTSILAMTNIGLGTASQIFIVKFLGRKQTDKASNILTHSTLLITGLFLAVTLLILLAHFLGLIHFQLIKQSHLVLLLLTTAYFLNLLTKPLRGYWVYHGKYNLSAKYDNLQGIGELLCLTIIPILGLQALWVAFSSVIVNLLWSAWYFYRTKNVFDLNHVFISDPKLFKVIINKGIGFQFSALWQAILYQIPLWIISITLSSVYVGLWGSLRAFTRVGNQIIELISLAIGSEFQILISQRRFEKVISIMLAIIQISLMVSISAAIGLWLLGPAVYRHWIIVAPAFEIDRYIWLVMGMGLIFFSIWRITFEIPVALNRPWKINFLGVVFSTLSCLFTYFTISKIGLLGVAIGTLLFDFLMAVFIPRYSFKLLGIKSLTNFRIRFGESLLEFRTRTIRRR